jgi:hypothetical protein
LQECALELLYRHVHIKRLNKLAQLADCVVRSSAEDINLLDKTESIKLSFRGLNHGYVDALLTILYHTPKLLILGADEPIMPSILLALPKKSVLALSLVVGAPSGSSLALLHSFTALTSLSIHDELNPVIPSRALVLPLLHTLNWTASAFISPSQVQYLARSQLPALRALHFGLPLLSAADAHLLRSFFISHGHVLRIALELPFIALAGLFSCLGAPCLSFPSSVPPSSIASLHNPHVRSLAFRAKLPGDDVWPLLDAFARAPNAALRTLTIALPSVFTWTCGERDERHATFVGRLVVHAIALRKRDIHILDERGDTAWVGKSDRVHNDVW